MMRKSWKSIIRIMLFLILLMGPLLGMDWVGGKKSTAENRTLASFPFSINSETGKISSTKSAVENWLSDNIGFRNEFVKLYSNIKINLLGLLPGDKVIKGQDDWFFYTADNNIEIATGEYPLTESDLKKIAEYQQQISDYYRSAGKKYILMLTPSKVSIYPEYLPMYDEALEETPVDIVTEYLREHTDVAVYNSKDVLLTAKNEGVGRLYHKTDTHWNELGSYYVYRGLHEFMRGMKILDDTALEVEFVPGLYKGEFSNMLGHSEILDAEEAPVAKWEYSFEIVTKGDFYTEVQNAQKRGNKQYNVTLTENTHGNGLCLQIYGDSQLRIERKLPLYLAEHFSYVVNYRIRNVSSGIDAVANPDVVVFSCSERYIGSLLTVPPEITRQIQASNLPENVRDGQTQSYRGMCLDKVNDAKPKQKNEIDRSAFAQDKTIELIGWAADFQAKAPLSALYLQIGDRLLQCTYGIERASVSTYFKDENLKMSGFKISFPAAYLDDIKEVRFIQVGTDGSYRYEDVVFSVKG